MQTNFPITGPLSLGDLLDRTFRIYRARFGLLVLTAAIFLTPAAVITGALIGRSMVTYFDVVGGAFSQQDLPPDSALVDAFGSMFNYFALVSTASLITLVANGMVSLATTRHVVEILHDRETTLTRATRSVFRKLLPLFGMYIASGIVIAILTLAVLLGMFLILALFGALFAVAGAAFSNFGSDLIGVISMVGAIIIFLIGYFIAILIAMGPYLYLSARWLVALPTLVTEDMGPIAALRRSWRLTRGQVWRSVGYLVLLTILNLLVISAPAGIIQLILLALSPFSEELNYGLSTAATSIFSIIWQPLYAVAVVLLYYDLRVRGESYDLQLRLDQLEANSQDVPDAIA